MDESEEIVEPYQFEPQASKSLVVVVIVVATATPGPPCCHPFRPPLAPETWLPPWGGGYHRHSGTKLVGLFGHSKRWATLCGPSLHSGHSFGTKRSSLFL